MSAARAAARGAAAALCLVGLLVACGCGERAGSIDGRAVASGSGVAGATVEVYLTGSKEGGGTPFATTATGPDGGFRLPLPTGSYWVWIKDLENARGPRRLAEVPGNPVQVAAGRARALGDVELHEAGRPALAAAPGGAGIRGRILYQGAPAEETAVMIYDAASGRVAGPGYVALMRTDAAGRYQVDLPPGSYRLAARRRRGGGASGFLEAGDLSATAPQDPLVTPQAGYRELGDLELHAVDADKLAAGGARALPAESPTVIEGRVLDLDGRPRAGQFVLAYRDEGMIGRPEALARTGAAGEFSLALPAGGTYFLGARSSYGGPRQPGEWAGRLAGRPDSGLEVPAGRRVRGATILMEQVW